MSLDSENRGVSRVTPPESLADMKSHGRKSKAGGRFKKNNEQGGHDPGTPVDKDMGDVIQPEGAVPSGDSKGPKKNAFDRIRDGMKQGMQTLSSGLKDLFTGASGGAGAVLRTIANGVSGAAVYGITRIAGKLGISSKTTVFIIACVLAGGGSAGAIWYQGVQQQELIRKSDVIEKDCSEEVEALKGTYTPSGDVSVQQLESAKKIWSLGKAIGLTDEQCAGMLGNMMEESHLDPTTIEAVYDEPFSMDGPKKSIAKEDLCAFMRTVVAPAYVNSGWNVPSATDENGHTVSGSGGNGTSLNTAYYVATGYGGCFCPGIGLFQATGPEGGRLQEFAAGANMDWWELDLQLAYMVAPVANGGYERGEWLLSDWSSQAGTPEDAAHAFNINFEGNSSDFKCAERQAYARQWYMELRGYNDTTYGKSILALAETVIARGTGNAAANAEDDCAEAERSYDNSSLAEAAVAYAWRTTDLGRGNNGTPLYQAVHDAVFPGDGYYMSCDRGVATAVRWSGTDDSMPSGNTDYIDEYFHSSSKWEDLGEFDGDIMKLEPGDILNTTSARRGQANGHIVVYVSNEVVQKKFPGSTASFVSASLNIRSPGCEVYNGGFVGEGYHVYRCIQPEENSVYTNVAEGFNGSDGSGS